MKIVFVLLDSLNRNAMEPYGSTTVKTPNFNRFQQRAVTFDNHYVGSLPCMPARRDLHTGRSHFLHRSWGPLEPFDDSLPQLLKQNGTYSHLITDHHHYFADGGAMWTGQGDRESRHLIIGESRICHQINCNLRKKRFTSN